MGWRRDAFELIVRACATSVRKVPSCAAEPRSIFVLRNNDIGDLLVITPLFEALRRRFPSARIVAGVGDWAAPALKGNPNVDEVFPLNAPWYNAKVKPQGCVAALRYIMQSPEVARLRAARHDIGIDVLGSGLGSLLLLRSGIPFRLGVRGYAGGHSATQSCVKYDPNEHVGRSALRFAEMLGATDLPSNRPQLFLDVPANPSGAIIFAPGGGYREKCWPIEHFEALAGRVNNIPIHVIGGEGDRAHGLRLAKIGPHVINLTCRLTLRESFAAIAASRLVVCNSSMAMHAAAAFNKPAIVTLGPDLPDAAQHAAQWGYSDTHLLAQPSPAEVYEKLLCLLAKC